MNKIEFEEKADEVKQELEKSLSAAVNVRKRVIPGSKENDLVVFVAEFSLPADGEPHSFAAMMLFDLKGYSIVYLNDVEKGGKNMGVIDASKAIAHMTKSLR